MGSGIFCLSQTHLVINKVKYPYCCNHYPNCCNQQDYIRHMDLEVDIEMLVHQSHHIYLDNLIQLRNYFHNHNFLQDHRHHISHSHQFQQDLPILRCNPADSHWMNHYHNYHNYLIHYPHLVFLHNRYRKNYHRRMYHLGHFLKRIHHKQLFHPIYQHNPVHSH